MLLACRLFFLLYGQQPNELALKKLAMFGCAALVFAHAVKNRIPANSYAGEAADYCGCTLPWFTHAAIRVADVTPRIAGSCASQCCIQPGDALSALARPPAAGLLLHGNDSKPKVGAGKSAVLLLSRLLMGSLFVFVGVTQMQRVIARDWVLHVQVRGLSG